MKKILLIIAAVYLIICLIIFLIGGTGLISAEFDKETEALGHYHREFTSVIDNPALFYGTLLDTVEYDNREYQLLQFQDILRTTNQHKDRYLNILIPTDDSVPNDPRLVETDQLKTGNKAVALIFKRYSCLEQDIFYFLLGQKVGASTDLDPILVDHTGIDLERFNDTVALAYLDFAINYSFVFQFFQWEKDSQNNWVCTQAYYSVRDSKEYLPEIQWIERDRTKYILRKIGYVGTLLADLITAPFQFLFLLGFGGGF